MILLSHPDVSEVSVVGKPAGEYGELPVAFVVLKPGATLTEQHLQDFVVPLVILLVFSVLLLCKICYSYIRNTDRLHLNSFTFVK